MEADESQEQQEAATASLPSTTTSAATADMKAACKTDGDSESEAVTEIATAEIETDVPTPSDAKDPPSLTAPTQVVNALSAPTEPQQGANSVVTECPLEVPAVPAEAPATQTSPDEKKSLVSLKPKRPLSAYNFFFQEERSRLLGVPPCTEDEKKRRKHRKSHGKIAFTDLARHIGQKWKELAPEDKTEYEKKQQEDRRRYHRELTLFDKMIKEIHGTVAETDGGVPKEKKSKTSEDGEKKLPSRPSAAEGDATLLRPNSNNAAPNYDQQMAMLLNMHKPQQLMAPQLHPQMPFFPPGPNASAPDPTTASALLQLQQRQAMDSHQYQRATINAMYDSLFRNNAQVANPGLGSMLFMNGLLPPPTPQGGVVDNRSMMLNRMQSFGNFPSFPANPPTNAGNPHVGARPSAVGFPDAGHQPPYSLPNTNALNDRAAPSRQQQERNFLAFQQQLQQAQQKSSVPNSTGMPLSAASQNLTARFDGGLSSAPTNHPLMSSSLNGVGKGAPIPGEDFAASMNRQHQERQQQIMALQQLQQQSQFARAPPDASR